MAMFLLLLAMFLLLLAIFYVAGGDVLIAVPDVLVAAGDVLVAVADVLFAVANVLVAVADVFVAVGDTRIETLLLLMSPMLIVSQLFLAFLILSLRCPPGWFGVCVQAALAVAGAPAVTDGPAIVGLGVKLANIIASTGSLLLLTSMLFLVL